jgi:hypothetical protein
MRVCATEMDEKVHWPPGRAGQAGDAADMFFGGFCATDLDDLIGDEMEEFEFYDLAELRDGFYDAFFLSNGDRSGADLDDALVGRPLNGAAILRWSTIRAYAESQAQHATQLVQELATTRAGLQLLKDFLGFFAAYALCLVDPVRAWLGGGRYSYVLVVSAVYNHPGRTVGAQMDGAVGTIVGTAVGLGWGALGLWLSTASAPARAGFAGILAAFLLSFLVVLSLLRATFARLYQAVICAGIAVAFALLAEVSPGPPRWERFFSYGVSWALGQAVSMAICVLFLPDAGSRPLATAFNYSFKVMLVCQHAFTLLPAHCADRSTGGRRAWCFLNPTMPAGAVSLHEPL